MQNNRNIEKPFGASPMNGLAGFGANEFRPDEIIKTHFDSIQARFTPLLCPLVHAPARAGFFCPHALKLIKRRTQNEISFQ